MELIQTQEFQRRDTNGYISILTDSGWKKKHVFMIEKFIGRELNEFEVVHHDNFLKQDNRIDNLTLFPNQTAHAIFHRQLRQFKNTQPRRTEIIILKENMKRERLKNLGEDYEI